MQRNRITQSPSNQLHECAEQECIVQRIGIAADEQSFDMKSQMLIALEIAGYHVVDFTPIEGRDGDEYADSLVPMAESVATGDVTKGLAIFASGVSASIIANKVPGVRAGFITDSFSAHQGVEDDAMNLICIGSQVTGQSLAWELVQIFIRAQFGNGAAHRKRLRDMASIERKPHSLQKHAR